jgi:glucose/arabinose dehydrogenase
VAAALVAIAVTANTAQVVQQEKQEKQPKQPIGVPVTPLGDGPFVFDTAEQHKIRVTVVTKGLVHPWSLAFLREFPASVREVDRPRLLSSWSRGGH